MHKITSKVKLIGGVLSFMILATVLITVYINHISKQDSIVIDVAGKQRMLSQKISKDVFWLQSRFVVDFSELKNSIKEFENSLEDLINGNTERGIYEPPKACIKERLLQVRSLWLPYKENAEKFMLLKEDTQLLMSELPHKNEKLLDISDQIVKEMVKVGLSGNYIDDSGRQRMLTQKILLHSTQYLITAEAKHFKAFHEAYGLYDITLKRFIQDEVLTKTPRIKQLLIKNEKDWSHYSDYILDLMEKQRQINSSIRYIKDVNLVLLETMNSAVAAYSKHSEAQRAFLQYFQYAASLIALFFMLYSAVLIKDIEAHFDEFLRQSEAMANSMTDEEVSSQFVDIHNEEDELTLASRHMSHFAMKMTTVLEHAQQAINESEQAAKELASVTDSMDSSLGDLELDEASKKDIDRTIDTSEDIVIQSLEELSSTSKLLTQLQNNLNLIISKTQN
ncbi:MAG: type IV pili methyl-accepting chemotaxis transducer N-terminal domain-containing protein [Campylobacterota bacterium]|nr:type IV pili methyl-accepting chemotaxis transducer N-terminal domain-containing protein [Campylobacterota bacterium]